MSVPTMDAETGSSWLSWRSEGSVLSHRGHRSVL
jgi:hypothetical protein